MAKGDMWYRYKPRSVRAFRFGYHENPQWFYDCIDKGEIQYVNDDMCLIEQDNGLTLEQQECHKGDYIVLSAYGYPIYYEFTEFIRTFENVIGEGGI